jgi:hypothetical protein
MVDDDEVKTSAPSPTARPALPSPARARSRSRFGYDGRWWGDAAKLKEPAPSYWSQTRQPLASLLFVLPILLAYELGVWGIRRLP